MIRDLTLRLAMVGVIAVLMAAAREARAGMISIDSSTSIVQVYWGFALPFPPVVNQFDNSIMIPTSTQITAADGVGASTTTSIASFDYLEQGAGTVLNWDLDQLRNGNANSHALFLGIVGFTVNEDTTYDLSGYFDMTGSGNVILQASLREQIGTILFWERQESRNTPDESLFLGQTVGDVPNTEDVQSNFSLGSLTGNLIAGHSYQLMLEANIENPFENFGSFDAGASAVGNFRLEVGDAGEAAAVPEPSSLALLGCGVVSTLLGARRRRHAARTESVAS